MDKEKVLVRRTPDGSFEEVGVVRKSAGKTLTIAMHDGSDVVRERAKDELTPTRWSYIHLLRVYPDALVRGLDEVPAVVFRQVLVEAGKALRAADLRNRLKPDAGAAATDHAWKTAQPLLAADPDVEVSDSRPSTYRLKSGNPEFLGLFPLGDLRPAQNRSRPEGSGTDRPEGPSPTDESSVILDEDTSTAGDPSETRSGSRVARYDRPKSTGSHLQQVRPASEEDISTQE